MATPSTASHRPLANGAAKQVKAGARRVAQKTAALPQTIKQEARHLGRTTSQWLRSAASTTRRHPYAAAGIVALAGAVIGGLFWARRR